MNTGLLLSLLSSDLFVGTVLIVGAALIGLLIYRVLFGLLTSAEQRRNNQTLTVILHGIRRPAGFAIILLCESSVLPYCRISSGNDVRVEHFLTVVTIAAIAWGIIAATKIATTIITSRYSLDAEDNLHGREIETRVNILSRVTIIAVAIIGLAAALMTFPSVRALGTTLLASAGLAGIAAGVSARPILENLIAGVQIAFTQPIRLDDAVIVENEFGRIEQITSTYVVIRLWDLRRMVVPLTYFINTPFQNWTRHSADLIGTVMLFAGYDLPIDDLRTELMSYIKTNPRWDGQVVALQITDTTENNMQVRVLVSAKNAPTVFDLRCEVREHLITFMQRVAPKSLPSTTKITLDSERPDGGGGAAASPVHQA